MFKIGLIYELVKKVSWINCSIRQSKLFGIISHVDLYHIILSNGHGIRFL